MPGSPTTPGRAGTRADAPVRVAFRHENSVGTRDSSSFAAQWLACALPYRRFTPALAGDGARLGAGADRYSFIVVDLHHLLPAGLPAHSQLSVDRRTPEFLRRSSGAAGAVRRGPAAHRPATRAARAGDVKKQSSGMAGTAGRALSPDGPRRPNSTRHGGHYAPALARRTGWAQARSRICRVWEIPVKPRHRVRFGSSRVGGSSGSGR
jgi:hypothetical protein